MKWVATESLLVDLKGVEPSRNWVKTSLPSRLAYRSIRGTGRVYRQPAPPVWYGGE